MSGTVDAESCNGVPTTTPFCHVRGVTSLFSPNSSRISDITGGMLSGVGVRGYRRFEGVGDLDTRGWG